MPWADRTHQPSKILVVLAFKRAEQEQEYRTHRHACTPQERLRYMQGLRDVWIRLYQPRSWS